MSPNVGTPDWQSGVVSPQMLLGSFASGINNQTVNIPPNSEVLYVSQRLITSTGFSFTATGVTTGDAYPVYRLPYAYAGPLVKFMVIVSSALDSQITINWAVAPTVPWYVVSDAGGRFVLDMSIAAASQTQGSTSPASLIGVSGADGSNNTHALLVDTAGRLQVIPGNDGLNAHQLQTDTNGRAIPLVPTLTTGFIAVPTANTSLLAAPSSGAWYLFGADFRNTTAAAAVFQVGDGAANAYSNVIISVNTSMSIDLKGYRTTAAVYMLSSATGGYVTLRYAPGP